MKFSLSLSAIKAPTPKLISHIGSSIFAAASAVSGWAAAIGNTKIAGIVFGAGFLGKFLGECFTASDDKPQTT